MKWVVYNLLFLAVYPFLLPGFLLRMVRRGGYAARLGDRFALYPAAVRSRFGFSDSHAYRKSHYVWIHAVSVGEVQVAGQLMREWRKTEPSVRFCFSTTSSTGWKMAEREVTPDDVLIYNPLDFPTFVKAALRTVRPRAIVLTESEIWPNFIRRAHRYGVPLFLINARVSDRSAPRYRAGRFFFRDVFECFSRIFAQSDLDRDRLLAAGAPAARTSVTGSFKFDVARQNAAKEAELRDWIFGPDAQAKSAGAGRRKILLGGSIWPGEDRVLIEVYKSLLALRLSPAPLLVLAPRHFEKADDVEANVRAAGFTCRRRSRGDTVGEVVLCDTTGELMGLYGVSDVVFVGKSLCAHGSQNMIEPCLCGKPTLVGPHTENFRPVMSDLLASEAIVQVRDARDLAARISAFLADPVACTVLGERARAAVERRCGVVVRCVSEIKTALLRALPAVVLLLAFAVGCSEKKPAAVSRPPVAEAVSNAISDIRLLEGDGERVRFVSLDVADWTADRLRSEFLRHDARRTHLWMPGERDWLLVVRPDEAKVSMAAAMDRFAADPKSGSAAEVFASYVGTLSEVLPAFEVPLDGTAVPQWLVLKEIPEVPWLDASGVESDIRRKALYEIRSMQLMRRTLLKGNIRAALAKDAAAECDAIAEWAKVQRRNPRDPMLQERKENLRRNAKGFIEVLKIPQAMKCYETLFKIDSKDAAAIHNFGQCLKRLGKTDLGERFVQRAEVLLR